MQLRTVAQSPPDLGADKRAEIVSGARQAVLDVFTAFNAGDVNGMIETLNHPHIFMAPGGGFLLSEDASEGPHPNFEQMRQRENWHMGTIDALEASIVTRDKAHVELTFTRWHQDGTRYWTALDREPARAITGASRCARSCRRPSIREGTSTWTGLRPEPHATRGPRSPTPARVSGYNLTVLC